LDAVVLDMWEWGVHGRGYVCSKRSTTGLLS
jgi:hypothetical protein